MREILFRGKRCDNGEWVDGFLLKECNYATCSWNLAIEYKTDRFGKFAYDVAEVVTETVSQFTGLTDKNGKKIFEGDIVEFDGELCYAVYYIIFVDGCFRIAQNGKYSYTLHNLYSSLEVIGNIHDHPELLKGGEE